VLVVLASFEGRSDEFSDDLSIVSTLRGRGVDARVHAWTDADVGWDEADLVVVTTTWDYMLRQADFLDWVGGRKSPVLNDPALLVWNCDKHYLADLASAGIPTVPTSFVSPGEPLRPLVGEVVVKPTVSAGARDTGWFGSNAHPGAGALIACIHASGRTAMVQPYLASVERVGETAVVITTAGSATCCASARCCGRTRWRRCGPGRWVWRRPCSTRSSCGPALGETTSWPLPNECFSTWSDVSGRRRCT
jgi:hypothetical protein